MLDRNIAKLMGPRPSRARPGRAPRQDAPAPRPALLGRARSPTVGTLSRDDAYVAHDVDSGVVQLNSARSSGNAIWEVLQFFPRIIYRDSNQQLHPTAQDPNSLLLTLHSLACRVGHIVLAPTTLGSINLDAEKPAFSHTRDDRCA